MAKIKISFTEDQIKLIRNLRTVKFEDDKHGLSFVGNDVYSLWGGNFPAEDIARMIDKWGDVIPETVEDPFGPRFKEETQEYIYQLDSFIVEHLVDIEEILHQFCTEGIKPNVTYWCYDYQRLWKIEE